MNLNSTARIFLFPLALCLPLTAAGCGQTACFVWNADEGACPAQDKALRFFSDPECPGTVISVDSDGNFGNDLCCYAVTQDDTGINSDTVPCAARGTGGAGGSFGTGTVGATSGVGGNPGCTRCEEAFSQNGLFVGGLCSGSDTLLSNLATCLCTGPCASPCQSTLCMGINTADQACIACLTDASNGCGTAFTACTNDI